MSLSKDILYDYHPDLSKAGGEGFYAESMDTDIHTSQDDIW